MPDSYNPEWYLTEDTEEAREHRRFLAEHEVKETARSAVSTPRLKPNPEYVTRRELDDIMEALGKMTGEFVAQAVKDRMKWCGTWRSGVQYSEHDVVQDKGALHICEAPTSDARPGQGSGWRMMHKTVAKP
jgi:hypothetical protein